MPQSDLLEDKEKPAEAKVETPPGQALRRWSCPVLPLVVPPVEPNQPAAAPQAANRTSPSEGEVRLLMCDL